MSSVGRSRPGGLPRALGWLSVLGLLTLAAVGPNVGGAAASDTPGNNGTVKIHEGATETEPGPQNEPHVCEFHLHFFFADPEQAGTWEIQEWSPGDKGFIALEGTYDTDGDGEDRQPAEGVYTLRDGHYKLFWDGDLDTDKHDKHKVFWVDCAPESPAPSGRVDESQSASSSAPPSDSAPPSNSAVPTGCVNPATGAPSSLPVGGIGGPTGPIGGSSGGQEGPIGGVGGVTGAPTLPPTDALAEPSATSTSSWRLALVAMASLLAAVLVVTPPAKSSRRR